MGAGPIPKFIVAENEVSFLKIVWTPPFSGSWKLNYAHAYNWTSRKAFVGCVIRCENAAFKALSAGEAGQKAWSITDAALMALSEAAGLAARQGGEFLEIEGESETTFSLVTGQITPSDEVTGELLSIGVKRNFRNSKETNPPPDVAAILDADVNGRWVPWEPPSNT